MSSDPASVPASPDSAPAGAILVIDYGTVRVGMAQGELSSGLVLPLPVLAHPETRELLVERLVELIRAREAAVVVLGNPLHKSGAESDMSRRVRELMAALAEQLPDTVELVLQDERHTSVEAEGQLAAMGLKWWQYDKGQVDTMAAMTLVRQELIRRRPELGRQAAPPPEPEPVQDEKPGRAERRRDLRKRRKQRRGEA